MTEGGREGGCTSSRVGARPLLEDWEDEGGEGGKEMEGKKKEGWRDGGMGGRDNNWLSTREKRGVRGPHDKHRQILETMIYLIIFFTIAFDQI